MTARAALASPPRRALLAAATLVAAVATAGSLWFSLGLGLVPCELCWYQRILMYPLVVVLGVGAFDDRADAHRTALPLSLAGLALAAYHSAVQATAAAGGVPGCGFGGGASGGCGAVLWRLPALGLTIPNLSLLAFLLVSALVLAARRAS